MDDDAGATSDGSAGAMLLLIAALLLCVVVAPVARGCGAYPPPALEDAPAPPVTRAWSVAADDAGANTCAQMTTDDVLWQLLDAEHAGRTLRFVGCVEVVP